MRILFRCLEICLGLLLGAYLLPRVAAHGWLPIHHDDNLPVPQPWVWKAADNVPASPVKAMEVGVNVGLGTEIPFEDAEQVGGMLDRLDLRWVRNEITWAQVEREFGRYDFHETDRVVAALRSHGYRVLGMLCYGNPHYPQSGSLWREAFARYAEATARHYRGQVDDWEIWNEPNSPEYWSGSLEDYADLVAQTVEAVRRGNTQARVATGGVSGVDIPYVEALCQQGVAEWVDAIGVHPYAAGWTPESIGLRRQLQALAARVDAYGPALPLWITEIGYGTRSNPDEERLQLELLERTLILAAQSRVVSRLIVHTLWSYPDDRWVLFRSQGTPRPAASIGETAARLRRSEPLGSDLPATQTRPWAAGAPWARDPLQSWAFETPRGWRRAVWTTAGSVGLPRRAPSGRGGWQRVTTRPLWLPR